MASPPPDEHDARPDPMPSRRGQTREVRAPGDPVDVVAAGAVVLGRGKRVLLVHRPKYDDWSFPKGKLEPGEHVTSCAVRESAEETGLRVRLGLRLGSQHYTVSRGEKTVHYWLARPVGGDDVSGWVANGEIDEVAWVDRSEARSQLTYPHDVDTLDEACGLRRRTRTLVVLRHGEAEPRKAWRGDDRRRPLQAQGRARAAPTGEVLAAYDVRRLVSSSSTRCVETLTPAAELLDVPLRREDCLSEEDATPQTVSRLMTGLVSAPRSVGSAVLCTHRPVLPLVFDALGVPDPRLEPGEMLVLHLRKGHVVGTERHLPG